jgi:protein arginine kinase activator
VTCDRCGKREASVRLIEEENGRRRHLWLCPACAGAPDGDLPFDDEDPERDLPTGDWEGGEDNAALERFIGQMFTGLGAREADAAPDCPACGTSYAGFRSTGRLGCPQCYVAFRRFLLPFLGRFHRQVTHLGKFPVHAVGATSRLGEITRNRIALEKAVAAEDFEEAARLRDRIRRLEAGEPADREETP